MRLARTLLIVAVILLAIGLMAATASPSCSPVTVSTPPGVHCYPPVFRCTDSTSGVAPVPLAGGAALLVLGLWRAGVSR